MRKISFQSQTLMVALVFCIGLLSTAFGQQSKQFTAQQQQADLEALYKTFQKVHPNLYAYISKVKAEKAYKKLHKKLQTPMSRTVLYRELAGFASIFKDGHSIVTPLIPEFRQYAMKGGKILPFEVTIQDDKIWMAKNLTGNADLKVNSQLLSINGVKSQQILKTFRTYFKEIKPAFNDKVTGLFFKEFFWITYGAVDQLKIKYLTYPDKQKKDAVVPTVNFKVYRTRAKAAQPGKTALPYTFQVLNGQKIAVINITKMANLKKFTAFLRQSFKEIHEKNIPNLIIDIRKNGGGRSALGDSLFNYITNQEYTYGSHYQINITPEIKKMYQTQRKGKSKMEFDFVAKAPVGKLATFDKAQVKFIPKPVAYPFKGKVYLLTSAFTYSSANIMAAGFKCNNMGTVIGEETGQTTIFFGDKYRFALPNSKLKVSCSFKQFFLCEPSRTEGIKPHHRVKQKASDTSAGIDTVLEYTEKLIRKTSNE